MKKHVIVKKSAIDLFTDTWWWSSIKQYIEQQFSDFLVLGLRFTLTN